MSFEPTYRTAARRVLTASMVFLTGIGARTGGSRAEGIDPALELPHWIWAGERAGAGGTVYLRRTIELDGGVRTAVLHAAASGRMTVAINGEEAVVVGSDARPERVELSRFFRRGRNAITVCAESDRDAPTAVALRFEIILHGFAQRWLVTDSRWLSAPSHSPAPPVGWDRTEFDDSGWKPAYSFGPVDRPGLPFGDSGLAVPATERAAIDVPPGFDVELVRAARVGEGSWISLAFDPEGRVTVGVENGGALRMELDAESRRVERLERLENFPGEARGLLYAHGSLYANVSDYRDGRSGVYRLRDGDGDGAFEEVELLRRIDGPPGHGRNGFAVGPDGLVYVVCGDDAKFPAPLAADSPYIWAGDGVLPDRPRAASGGSQAAVDRFGPGGFVARTTPDGREWQVVAAGFRNPYGIAFDASGELFTFDADMEPDAGLPWYRPCRIYHVTSGGEYGWRRGTAQWPSYRPDVLPPALDVGLASPTGVAFGTGAKFPLRYRRALFAGDWSYGRILAVHLSPSGSTYRGEAEDFLIGRPFNVTDIAVGPDGALWATTGGRGTQAGLYRITYSGGEPLESAGPLDLVDAGADHGALGAERRRLEGWHGRPDPGAIDELWPYLSHEDRYLRHAARIALEHQPIERWRERAVAAGDPAALLAFVRRAAPDDVSGVLVRLAETPLPGGDEGLVSLRLVALGLLRAREIPADVETKLVERLAAAYPSGDERSDRELANLLVYLNAPGFVERTMPLLEETPAAEQQIFYAWMLRHVERGWTEELRRRYFAWFPRARDYVGGAQLHHHLARLREDALGHVEESTRQTFRELAEALQVGASPDPFERPQSRPLVRRWRVDDIAPLLNRKVTGTSAENGRAVFIAAGCAACHRFGDLGRVVGPDLTSVSSRFGRRDVLAAILEPSRAVDPKYLQRVVRLRDGRVLTGTFSGAPGAERDREADGELRIQTDPYDPTRLVRVARDEVLSLEDSEVSPMPAGLLDGFSAQHVMDLLEWLRSEAGG